MKDLFNRTIINTWDSRTEVRNELIESSRKNANEIGFKLQKDYVAKANLPSIWNVSRQTIHNWGKKGLLPEAHSIGGRVYFLKSEIEYLLIQKSK